jgi:hypothetical protein
MSHDHSALIAQFRETLTQQRYNPLELRLGRIHRIGQERGQKPALCVVSGPRKGTCTLAPCTFLRQGIKCLPGIGRSAETIALKRHLPLSTGSQRTRKTLLRHPSHTPIPFKHSDAVNKYQKTTNSEVYGLESA